AHCSSYRRPCLAAQLAGLLYFRFKRCSLRITTAAKDLGPRRCQNASMSEPNRRLRARALVAPLTLVTAAASLVPIAAGARLLIQGDSAPSIARVVASGTGTAHHHPRPVRASAAPAVLHPTAVPGQ